jgi:hypothetical protein
MKNKIITFILQLCLTELRRGKDSDVRLVYDNPQGFLSFQGNIKYVKKIPIPKRDA